MEAIYKKPIISVELYYTSPAKTQEKVLLMRKTKVNFNDFVLFSDFELINFERMKLYIVS